MNEKTIRGDQSVEICCDYTTVKILKIEVLSETT